MRRKKGREEKSPLLRTVTKPVLFSFFVFIPVLSFFLAFITIKHMTHSFILHVVYLGHHKG